MKRPSSLSSALRASAVKKRLRCRTRAARGVPAEVEVVEAGVAVEVLSGIGGGEGLAAVGGED